MDDDAVIAAGQDGSAASRIWHAPLIAHLALLAVVLVGVAALTSQPDSFTTDEGSYFLQLEALDAGSWTWSSGTEALDPDGTHFPIEYAERTDDGWVPLAKHPAWPWTASKVAVVTGVEHAYAVLGALAVLLTAAAAWAIASRHDARLRTGAFWLAGLAPVTVTAMFGWSHAVAAAAAGIAVLGAVGLVQDRAERRWSPVTMGALLGLGVVGGILVRTEGLLFAVALAAGLVVGGQRAGRRWSWCLGAGAGVVALALATVKAEALWITSITGGGTETFAARNGGGVVASNFLDGRYQGATRSLLDPRGGVLSLLLLVALVVAAVAAFQLVRGQRQWAPRFQIALGLTIVLFVVRAVEVVTQPITGLLVAWPIVVIGVAAAGGLLWRKVALESTVTALFAGAILATQYPDGGAVQWGGRFFTPLTVPLAILAVVGIDRLLTAEAQRTPADLRITRGLVAVAVILPLVLGAWVSASLRTFVTETYDGVDSHIAGVAVTPDPQLPRIMWRHDIPWLVVEETDGGDDLAALLGSLAEQPDAPDSISLVLRRYDLPQAKRVLSEDDQWTEVARNDTNGLTVVTLEQA